MDQLISNIEFSLTKLEWIDFADFIDNKHSFDDLKVTLEIEFGMDEPKMVDEYQYLSSIAYILNFVSKDESVADNPPETISIIKSILSVYIYCTDTGEIDFERLNSDDKNILGSYLMKNTWPELKNIFQNILDLSRYEKNIKLPLFLSENEKK